MSELKMTNGFTEVENDEIDRLVREDGRSMNEAVSIVSRNSGRFCPYSDCGKSLAKPMENHVWECSSCGRSSNSSRRTHLTFKVTGAPPPPTVKAGLGGRWEHCSPELLQAGIDCGSTPRRPCECEHGGSHDHFISGDRLEIETFDADGKRVQYGIGPTQEELQAAHQAGKCHAFCAYCITEAEQLMPPNLSISQVTIATRGCLN